MFVAFTLSQVGMVRHWYRLRAGDLSWRRRAAVNGFGALATGLVAVVVGVAKFVLGAWMVLVLLPVLLPVLPHAAETLHGSVEQHPVDPAKS